MATTQEEAAIEDRPDTPLLFQDPPYKSDPIPEESLPPEAVQDPDDNLQVWQDDPVYPITTFFDCDLQLSDLTQDTTFN
jgi:hypothetical protein